MSAVTERSSPAGTGAVRISPAELQPRLQALVAILADLDFAHHSDIETVKHSSADAWLRQSVIRTLEERHRERREPYLRQIAILEKRMQAVAA